MNILKDYNNYLRIERAMSQNTVASYCSDVAKFLEFFDTDERKVPAERLIAEDINEYLAFCSKRSRRSQARLLSALRSFYNWMVLEGMVKENPCDRVDMPKLGRYLPDVLSEEEVSRIIDRVDVSSWQGARDKAILEVLYGCGIRVSEAVGLKISCLYFTEGFVRVIGKGNKERFVYFGTPCRKAIDAYMVERKEKFLTDNRALFGSRNGNRISVTAVHRLVEKALKQAGLDSTQFSAHKLRHTAATMMLSGGVDVKTVQEVLGHENLNTTQIYTHIESTELKLAAEANPLSKLDFSE